MALAYAILAHKDPAQVERLLRAIAHPDNVYFLHYEKRAPRGDHEAMARLAREFPNLHLLPSRRILWGRFSQVATQLEGVRCALDCGRPWSHLITLTGQDFPLWPQAWMVDEMAAAGEASYLSFFDPFATGYWKNAGERLSRIYLDSAALESLLKVPLLGRWLRRICGWRDRMPCLPWVRRRPEWFRYWGGSNHVILSRSAASYLVHDPRARRIVRWLARSGHPDESLFQTVLLNGPLAASVVNDDRRAIRWQAPGAPNPLTLRCADLPWLRGEARRKGALFARKFDAAVDDEVLRELAKDLSA